MSCRADDATNQKKNKVDGVKVVCRVCSLMDDRVRVHIYGDP